MVTEVRVLGPVEVCPAGGAPSPVGGRRPGSILLALALAGGAAVSTDRLVSEVWGETPPPNAVDTLQSYLSRLRRVLEPDREVSAASTALVRTTAGYRLAPQAVAVDAARFDAEVTEARALAAVDDHAGAARVLAAALRRWRGPVGQGAELGERGRTEATRLDELRLTATEEWVHAELGLGHHHELTGELESLVVEHPTRERLHGLRMLALYRAGRQAEALAAFRQARSLLIEALGVEPSPQLHDLHARILAQDASLAPPVDDLVSAPPAVVATAPVGGDRASGVAVEPTGRRGGSPLGNLPAAMVELVGRDEHRRQLAAELERSRLVTLTGAGGCGKTQLALQLARDVADRYADGAWLVELGTVSEADGLLSHLAQVLGVDDAPLHRLLDGLVARLADRQLLLVLDNCEHLVDDCAMLVRDLLRRCPQLRVLTTSRQTLDLDGELAWRVPSLSLPAPDATLEQLHDSDAARLFIARAASARDGFTPSADDVPWIARICRELDGIPLALELAAARLRVLSVEEIAARLDDRFAVLRSTRRGVPARHQTLEAAIAWSYELLDPEAQRLLRRLAVFEGPFTVAAAEATCADGHLPAERILTLLEGLVDRSLVLTVDAPIGPARHALLQTIRSFAWSRVEEADAATLAVSHARWFADLADAAATELTGADQVRWLNLLHTDHADLRAALRWSLDHGRGDLALRIGAGVWWFWLQFGHAQEGADWLERILAEGGGGDVGDASTLLRAAHGAGRLAGAAGRTDRAVELLQRADELAVTLGDHRQLALVRARLAQQRRIAGDPVGAAAALEAARAIGCEDPWVLAGVCDVAGHLAIADGDLDAAAAAFDASERWYLEAQDHWSACLSRLGRAWVARARGELGTALSLHRQNLRSARSLTRSAFDFVGLARDLRGIAAIASTLGHDEPALRLCAASEALRTTGEVALTADERAEVDHVVARARATVGTPAAEQAQSAGRALAASDALELAGAVVDELASLGRVATP